MYVCDYISVWPRGVIQRGNGVDLQDILNLQEAVRRYATFPVDFRIANIRYQQP